ncbi:YdgA family protein [Pseudomonas huanghezhanensis]|uniref:YdgA family protein n=1 Tax=Pseudomonas huanghezhanensis TaxID=3002903 RepID=UPI00228677C0|nr:YdgA family protein [Pseudomonas sp. BSw22131]
MNKSAKIAVGVVVVAGALITAGAWYTGTQLEGVLGDALVEGNKQLKTAMVGQQGDASVELISLERHVFTSTAHYRVNLQSPEFNQGQLVEVLVVDHIEHGPFPWSRVKSLKLMPVMVASNAELEKNAFTERWFAMTNGQSPVAGQFSMGYDRAAQGRLAFLPIQFEDEKGTFKFSGFTLDAEASGDGEKLQASGNLDTLDINAKSEEGPVRVALQGFTFDTGGTKGKSGFYLGHSDAKVASAVVQVVGKPPIDVKNLVSSSLLQEVEGNLSAQVSYDIGMLSYNGKEIGSSQMLWKFANFDIASTQTLLQFYKDKIQPQAQAAAMAGERFIPRISPADQAMVQAEVAKLLAAKPHIELEKLALKTKNGESHFSLTMDLNNPTSLDQPAPVLLKQTLTQLDAKLSLSKPMIQDLAIFQANQAGVTDPATVAQQAKDAADTAGAMAIMLQLGKVEGDTITSNLHYANDVVDFNGEKMSAQQFAATMMSKAMMLKGGQ